VINARCNNLPRALMRPNVTMNVTVGTSVRDLALWPSIQHSKFKQHIYKSGAIWFAHTPLSAKLRPRTIRKDYSKPHDMPTMSRNQLRYNC
jgi:hypothetical protein